MGHDTVHTITKYMHMHSKMICYTQGPAILNSWHRLTMWRRQVHTLSLRTCLAQIQPPHRDSVKPSPLIETTSLLAAWTKGTGKWALTTNTKGVSFVGCSKIQYKFKHPYKHPCHRIINTVQYRTWKVHTTLWRRDQKRSWLSSLSTQEATLTCREMELSWFQRKAWDK